MRKASTAYREQDGWYRQTSPSMGEIVHWYTRIGAMSMRASSHPRPRVQRRSHTTASSATKPRLVQESIEFDREIGSTGTCQAPYHQFGADREGGDLLTDEVPQLPDHTMTHDGIADHFADNKTRPGCTWLRAGDEVKYEMGR